MSASLKIYDLDMFEDKFGLSATNQFLETFLSRKFYCHTLRLDNVLTRMLGSERADLYDLVTDSYDRNQEKFHNMPLAQTYDMEDFMTFTREERKYLIKMMDFLEEKCIISTWEVLS